MPTLASSNSDNVVEEMVRRFVQSKAAWADPWILERYVEPIEATVALAPTVGSADLAYEFGELMREDRTSFVSESAKRLNDRYVRILIQRPGSQPVPIWYGIVADTQTLLISNDEEGVQSFKAFELAHLLDREELRSSWVRPTMPDDPDSDEERETVKINRVVPFNERIAGGLMLGNQSFDISQDDGFDSWYFLAGEGRIWTAKTAAEYLLARYTPPEIEFLLVGQTDALNQISEVWSFEGKTVWGCLNDLIPKERGLGFRLECVGQGDEQTVLVVVESITEDAYSYADYQLPPNPNPLVLTLPNDGTGHLIDTIPFRTTATNQYDIIEVVGQRFLAIATWSFEDQNLERVWTQAEEAAYIAGVGDDEIENDVYRASDLFESVYSQFKVIDDWDGKNADGEGGEASITIPYPLEDGGYDDQRRGEFFNWGKRFDRQLPLRSGLDYSAAEQPELPVGREPDFKPLLAVCKWNFNEDESPKYVAIDRLKEADEDLASGDIRPLQNEFGVELKFSPRHFFGLNHFDSEVTMVDPEIDYETLIVTGAVESDDPPKIVLRRVGGSSAEVEKRLRIDVPGAETWRINPHTVVDVGPGGELVQYLGGEAEGPLLYLRNDKDKLQAVASFAQAWYGPVRQAVQIPIKQIGLYAPLGAVLVQISGVFGSEPVRTPITSISWNFRAATTTIATGYTEIDFVGLMGAEYSTEFRRNFEDFLANPNAFVSGSNTIARRTQRQTEGYAGRANVANQIPGAFR